MMLYLYHLTIIAMPLQSAFCIYSAYFVPGLSGLIASRGANEIQVFNIYLFLYSNVSRKETKNHLGGT